MLWSTEVMPPRPTDTAPTTLPLGRDSVTYRLTLEPVNVLVGGPRALMLQVMHPVVGAGVADHSDYEKDPWTRLIRTLQVMTQLALGTPEKSAEMRRLMRKSHATINGVRADGAPYRALDSENMLWVWATLLDTVMAVADGFVRPLGRRERQRLYEEWLLIAEGCGIARDDCPADVDAFDAYMERVVREELTDTEVAHGIDRTIRRPPIPFPLDRLAARVYATLLPGQLAPTLRARMGQPWSAADQARFERIALASRLFCRVTPGPLRRLPGAVAAFGTVAAPAPRPRRRLTTAAA